MLLVTLAGACGGNDDDVDFDAPEHGDAPTLDGELVDSPDPVDAPPIDAAIIDAPVAVCEAPPTPPVLPPARVTSGTRLVPRYVAEAVPGGVEVPYDIWDSALGIYCTPMPYHDGAIRCVPESQDVHLLNGRKYADAARTIPVAVEPTTNPTPVGTLSAVYQGGGFGSPFTCSGGARLSPFARFGALRGGTQYYRELGGPETVPAGYGIFDLTVIPDDFVALTEVRTQLSGQIAVRELHGTDGSRVFPTDFWDTDHDLTVVIREVGASHRLLPHTAHPPPTMRHLAPAPGVALGGVVDSAWCDTHDDIFSAPSSSACPTPPPRYVTDDDENTYEVVLQTATLYGCGGVPGVDAPGVQVLTYQTETYLASCRDVPITEWQEALLVTEGAGRLTTSVYSIGGVPFEWDRWRRFADAGLGIECSPRPDRNGSLRCLPIQHGMVTFSDAACTSRVVARNGPPVSYAFEGTGYSNLFPNPRGDITVYGVGAVRPAGPIYTINASGCSRIDNWTSYEIGPEIPPSAFVALELRDAP